MQPRVETSSTGQPILNGGEPIQAESLSPQHHLDKLVEGIRGVYPEMRLGEISSNTRLLFAVPADTDSGVFDQTIGRVTPVILVSRPGVDSEAEALKFRVHDARFQPGVVNGFFIPQFDQLILGEACVVGGHVSVASVREGRFLRTKESFTRLNFPSGGIENVLAVFADKPKDLTEGQPPVIVARARPLELFQGWEDILFGPGGHLKESEELLAAIVKEEYPAKLFEAIKGKFAQFPSHSDTQRKAVLLDNYLAGIKLTDNSVSFLVQAHGRKDNLLVMLLKGNYSEKELELALQRPHNQKSDRYIIRAIIDRYPKEDVIKFEVSRRAYNPNTLGFEHQFSRMISAQAFNSIAGQLQPLLPPGEIPDSYWQIPEDSEVNHEVSRTGLTRAEGRGLLQTLTDHARQGARIVLPPVYETKRKRK